MFPLQVGAVSANALQLKIEKKPATHN